MRQFQQHFYGYGIRWQVTPQQEYFMPHIGKINNHFVLIYDLP